MNVLAESVVDYLLEGDPEPLEEGVFDPYALKAVFMSGGGGSGKTFVSNNMFRGLGLKFVNQDTLFELFAKEAGIDLKRDIDTAAAQALRKRGKQVTSKFADIFIAQRLGLIIDSTAANTKKVVDLKKRLENAGYDTAMVFVNTSLETSLKRNSERSRVVNPEIVKADWEEVQQARDFYKRMFGSKFKEIQNDHSFSKQDIQRHVIPEFTNVALKLVSGPVKNPLGRKWMKKMTDGMDPNTKLGAGTGRVRDYQERQHLASQIVDQITEGYSIRQKNDVGSARLDAGTRSRVNRDLTKLGNDFRSTGDAHNKIADVLSKYGLEVKEVLDGFIFKQPEGQKLLDIGYDYTYGGGDDPFTPGPTISNSGLSFYWYVKNKQSGHTEVVAYLT